MPEQLQLKENTKLTGKYFPFNLFHNFNIEIDDPNILYIHWHENLEIIYIIEGHAEFTIGSEFYTVAPGDILFVNSGLLHSGYSINNTFVRYYALVFDKTLLSSQSPDPYHSRYIAPLIEGRFTYPGKIGQEDKNYLLYKDILMGIIREFDLKQPAYELAIKSYLYLISISVFRDYSHIETQKHTGSFYEQNIDRFRKLISYLEDHYNEKITIDQAAVLVNLSPYHFCKTFKKTTGRTFIEFLNLYRVIEAEKMLRNTSLPISEISEKVGFCNINYFDKIFKKYKRYPPSECRK